MRVCFAGDCHGRIRAMYDNIDALRSASAPWDLVIQVGDFGVWPDPKRIDRATRSHGDVGDFAEMQAAGWRSPVPTVFIAGNHEDFEYLERFRTGDHVLPGVRFLRWGEVLEFTVEEETLRIAGVGGCFGGVDFESHSLSGRRRRHYLRDELDRIRSCRQPIDVLVLHDAPAGRIEQLGGVGKPQSRLSKSAGLAELIADVQPRLVVTGHLHVRSERQIAGVRTIGMNLVPHPGSLLAVEVSPSGIVDLAEWGRADPLGARTWDGSSAGAEPGATGSVLRLVEALHDWARAALRDRKFDRQRRLEARAILDGHPFRNVLLDALAGCQMTCAVQMTETWKRVTKLGTGQRRDLNEIIAAGKLPELFP